MRRVVFIVSAGHSGSTLQDLLMGSHGAAFSLGEVKSLADRLADDPDAPLCGVWRDELSAGQLATFARVAGELNDRLLRLGEAP